MIINVILEHVDETYEYFILMFCTEVKSNIFPTFSGSLHVNVVLISFIFISVSVPAGLWGYTWISKYEVWNKCGPLMKTHAQQQQKSLKA